jgi:hypothetical protein
MEGAQTVEEIREVMEGRVAASARVDAYTSWIRGLSEWQYFITLTLAGERETILGAEVLKPMVLSEDRAARAWGRMVHLQNREVFGASYKRVLKAHSYFSYVVFTELQTREATHWHALTTGPIHMAQWHDWWDRGYALVIRVGETEDDQQAISRYLAKYVAKGAQLVAVHVAPDHVRQKAPRHVPGWWGYDAPRCGMPSTAWKPLL